MTREHDQIAERVRALKIEHDVKLAAKKARKAYLAEAKDSGDLAARIKELIRRKGWAR